MNRQRLIALMSLAAAATLAACNNEKKESADETPSPSAASTASSGAAAPAPGGKIIVVQLVTDGTGNRFEPSEIEAKKGDLIRFTLKAGVHNVHFLPDSNPGRTGLPAASDLLQLPGQTVDIPVTFGEGTYYFQCDPHAALGMKGHLKVDD